MKYAKMRIFVLFGLLLSLLQPMNTQAVSLIEKFSEDFETTEIDSYPSSFIRLYDGTGSANQKVVLVQSPNATPENMTTHAFYLQGANSWASEHLVNLPTPLAKVIEVEAYVAPSSGTWPGRIGLYNKDVGPWGTRISGVSFQNGHVYAIRNGNDGDLIDLGEYVLNNWHHVKLIHYTETLVYDVYLDGILAVSSVPFSTVPIQSLNLTSGNIGTNEIYFDEVRISYSEPQFTVTFDKNGGDTEADPTTISVSESVGKLSELPEKPTLYGHLFLDWWTGNGIVGDGIGPDANHGWGTMITTNTPITEDITVYAAYGPRINEGFQGYTLGSYPTGSHFMNLYNGAGDVHQKIITTTDANGDLTFAFHLAGVSSWASVQVLPLKLNKEQFVITRSMIKPLSGAQPALTGLYNPTDGTWGTWSSLVEFNNSSGSIIYALDADEGYKAVTPYEYDRWYHVMLVHDLWNRTYDVYVDGFLILSDVNMHSTSNPTTLALVAGNAGSNSVLFDDVAVANQNIYEVTFNGNGADYMAMPHYTDLYTKKLISFPIDAELENHTFEGWWTGNGIIGDGIGEDINNGWGTRISKSSTFTSNLSVYARFAIETHTVTVIRFDGDSQVYTLNHGENYYLAPLTDADLIFNGFWYKGSLIEASGYITVEENITLTASWSRDELIDADYGLKFEGMFDYDLEVRVEKLVEGDQGFDEVKAKLLANQPDLVMYALYRVTFWLNDEQVNPKDLRKIMIPYDSLLADLDILDIFYVSDDFDVDYMMEAVREDDGMLHAVLATTSYFAVAGSPLDELPDTSDPGSFGGWIGLAGLLLLLFAKKKD